MMFVRLLPVILSLLVLGAHFLRQGSLFIVGSIILLLFMLPIRKGWVAGVAQVVLVVGAAEWVRTLVILAQERMRAGEPYIRMVLILGGVALFTLLSLLVFRNAAVRRWYGSSPRPATPEAGGEAGIR